MIYKFVLLALLIAFLSYIAALIILLPNQFLCKLIGAYGVMRYEWPKKIKLWKGENYEQ